MKLLLFLVSVSALAAYGCLPDGTASNLALIAGAAASGVLFGLGSRS